MRAWWMAVMIAAAACGKSSAPGAELATSMRRPDTLIAANAGLFWIVQGSGEKGFEDGGILFIPAEGGAPRRHGTGAVAGLAIDPTGIYYGLVSGDGTALFTAPLTGGHPRELARDPHPSVMLALGGGALWWVCAACEVGRVGTSGGAYHIVATVPNARDLVADEGGAYVLTDGAIVHVTRETKATLIDGLADPGHLALESGNLFVTTENLVLEEPTTGGAPKVLVSGVARPWDVAVRKNLVAYTTLGGGTVELASVGGENQTPKVIARNAARPLSVAIDLRSDVYFTTEGPADAEPPQGRLYKATRK